MASPLFALGRGFLTGEAKRAEDYPEGDYRRNDPRYQGAAFDANLKAAAIVREIAAAKDAKPGQVALAWLLAKGDDIVPIPGTKRRTYLEENVAAAAIRSMRRRSRRSMMRSARANRRSALSRLDDGDDRPVVPARHKSVVNALPRLPWLPDG